MKTMSKRYEQYPLTLAQELVIEFLQSHDQAILDVGMGLSKTRATLEVISKDIIEGKSKGFLVIAPKRVALKTWVDEIAKWENVSWLKAVSLRDEVGKKAWRDGSADIYIINYDMLQQLSAEIMANTKVSPADTVVWDELTFAKNPSSKRVNAFRKYRYLFKRNWGMTGTFFSEGYEDIFAQVRLIDGGVRLGTAKSHYLSRYFDRDYMGYNYKIKPFADKAINAKIADIVLTLRTEDHLNVPKPIIVDIVIEMDDKTKDEYKRLKKKMVVDIGGKNIEAVNTAVLSNKLQQFVGGACYNSEGEVIATNSLKIDALKKLILEINSPVIVATRFIHEQERVLNEIPHAVKFHEDMLPAWNRGEISCIVAHPKSFGHGLNMQGSCHNLIWFTLSEGIDLVSQTNARIVRTGQTEVCKIHRLIVKDSIDEHIVKRLENKDEDQTAFKKALIAHIHE